GNVDSSEVRFDRFEEQDESKPVEEFTGLLEVQAVAKVQREHFEPARPHAEFSHDVIRDEENRTAVDAAGKTYADGRCAPSLMKPLCWDNGFRGLSRPHPGPLPQERETRQTLSDIFTAGGPGARAEDSPPPALPSPLIR